jgi:hypothetical protein
METYRDVISKWHRVSDLAADIEQKPATVQAWKARDNIRPQYWLDIVKAAQRRGFYSVTLETLAKIAEARPEPTN